VKGYCEDDKTKQSYTCKKQNSRRLFSLTNIKRKKERWPRCWVDRREITAYLFVSKLTAVTQRAHHPEHGSKGGGIMATKPATFRLEVKVQEGTSPLQNANRIGMKNNSSWTKCFMFVCLFS